MFHPSVRQSAVFSRSSQIVGILFPCKAAWTSSSSKRSRSQTDENTVRSEKRFTAEERFGRKRFKSGRKRPVLPRRQPKARRSGRDTARCSSDCPKKAIMFPALSETKGDHALGSGALHRFCRVCNEHGDDELFKRRLFVIIPELLSDKLPKTPLKARIFCSSERCFSLSTTPSVRRMRDDLLERTGAGAADRRHDADTNIFFAVCFDLQIVKPLDAVLICKIRPRTFSALSAPRGEIPRSAAISEIRSTKKTLGNIGAYLPVIVFDVWLGERARR